MAGFQFSPDGWEPLPDQDGAKPFKLGSIAPAAPPARPAATVAPAEPVAPTVPVKKAPDASPEIGTMGAFLKAARARLRVLKAELRRMKLVQQEHDELKRLLEAAKKKPASNLRNIRSAG